MDEQVKPAEWVLLPREATGEMMAAVRAALPGEGRFPACLLNKIYRAMLAASPSPEASELSNLQKMQSAALTLPPVAGVDREVADG